jgi:hypothetical protein
VLEFFGVRSVQIPIREEWGPAISVNTASRENDSFKIEMQSGDTITIEAQAFAFNAAASSQWKGAIIVRDSWRELRDVKELDQCWLLCDRWKVVENFSRWIFAAMLFRPQQNSAPERIVADLSPSHAPWRFFEPLESTPIAPCIPLAVSPSFVLSAMTRTSLLTGEISALYNTLLVL